MILVLAKYTRVNPCYSFIAGSYPALLLSSFKP
jgi:hypothetical protein